MDLTLSPDLAEPIEPEPDSDCDYTGGVNYTPSDDDLDDSDDCWSDAESLAELEGEELERNLRELGAELADLSAPEQPGLYDWVVIHKSKKDWMTAETSRSLGYNGQSGCTTGHGSKEARERAKFKKQAKTS